MKTAEETRGRQGQRPKTPARKPKSPVRSPRRKPSDRPTKPRTGRTPRLSAVWARSRATRWSRRRRRRRRFTRPLLRAPTRPPPSRTKRLRPPKWPMRTPRNPRSQSQRPKTPVRKPKTPVRSPRKKPSDQPKKPRTGRTPRLSAVWARSRVMRWSRRRRRRRRFTRPLLRAPTKPPPSRTKCRRRLRGTRGTRVSDRRLR